MPTLTFVIDEAPAYRPYTPEDDAIIIARYPVATLQAIAAEMGRRWTSVQQRVNLLIRQGRLTRRARFYAPPWTEADDEYLADNWGRVPDRTVARRLGRSINACKIRATRHHKMARKDNFYTTRSVARIFGVDDHLVVRWGREGLLPMRKSPVGAGGHTTAWRIDEPDIARFIRRYPWRYDHRRIEPGTYWRNLADRVWLRDPWVTADEAARTLGVCLSTVHRHLQRGWLPGKRTPRNGNTGVWLIRKADLASFAPRHPLAVMVGSVADRNRRLTAARAEKRAS